jgi:invasion protein IalB
MRTTITALGQATFIFATCLIIFLQATSHAQDGTTLLPGDPAASNSQSLLVEQGVQKAQYGDWRILCEAATGDGAARCALVQNIESAERPGFGLVVMILKTPDDKTRMRIAAPLGIFLPPGLGLRIDGEEVGNVPFWFCRPFACETEAIISSQIMEKLKRGDEALFVLFERPDKGTGLIVSLSGFHAGHQALNVWHPLVQPNLATPPPSLQ